LDKINCKLDDHPEMKKLADHHLNSFNYAMSEVLSKIPKYLRPIEIKSNEESKDTFKTLMISFEDLELGYIITYILIILNINLNIESLSLILTLYFQTKIIFYTLQTVGKDK